MRIGVFRSTVWVGVVSTVLSVALTVVICLLLGYQTFDEFRAALIFSTVIPFFISIGVSIPVFKMIEELHHAEREMRYHATHDTLTNLMNRRTVLEHIDYFWRVARREQHNFAIVLADIDDFKNINDTYGHAMGDAVLAALGTLFKSNLRASDLVGRYGGEEFVFFLPHASLDSAKDFTERLHRVVREKKIQLSGNTIAVTLSVGIADYRPNITQSVDDLLSAADSAMYVAKSRGKNRTVAFGTATLAPAAARIAVE